VHERCAHEDSETRVLKHQVRTLTLQKGRNQLGQRRSARGAPVRSVQRKYTQDDPPSAPGQEV
jgi:hypothetical protein